jgi:hypothetical protein
LGVQLVDGFEERCIGLFDALLDEMPIFPMLLSFRGTKDEEPLVFRNERIVFSVGPNTIDAGNARPLQQPVAAAVLTEAVNGRY